MNSRLFEGYVEHVRCLPVPHRFVFPFLTFAIDLDELPELERSIRWFNRNRFNLLSFYDGDYMPGRGCGTAREKLLEVLEQRGLASSVRRVELISCPRFCGYVFNPVSFYHCFAEDGGTAALVAEVHNTFNETHLYVLGEEESAGGNSFKRYQWCKEFHVSPFNDMNGLYRFYMHRSEDTLDIRVNLERDGRVVLTSKLYGSSLPISSANNLQLLVKYGLSAWQTMPRIVLQAARLRFQKNLPVYTKPIASSAMTIQSAPPSALQRWAMKAGFRFLSNIKRGQLTVVFPDGSEQVFGSAGTGRSAKLLVKNYDFFPRALLFGDIGFGESFADGQWESDDLTALLSIFLENEQELDDRSIVVSHLGRAANRALHFLQRNSRSGSKKNIGRHYDLSNELFDAFLDRSMTYSCAQFHTSADDLEAAQQNKIDSIIRKADIQADDHVLEIGCGWGSFAIAAAKQTGCRVTGVTLSRRQYELARRRVAEEGLDSQVEIQLRDYRDISGTFDKIVSIEMIEAVGHRYLGSFFRLCDRALKPDGLIVLQVITFPDYRYDSYRRGCDWIQKHVFPGGLCPSLSALCNAIAKNSRLLVEDIENIGVHYAETLVKWRERFFANAGRVRQLGFDDRFWRIWSYYFAYCEAGFSTRTLGTLQIVLTHPNNKRLPLVPCRAQLGS